jgi:hypothetical protein
MPTDLIHCIGIAAPVETIHRTITTVDGIKACWGERTRACATEAASSPRRRKPALARHSNMMAARQ